MKKKILVLFAQEWDLAGLSRPECRREFEFLFEGFDLFRFPDARLFFYLKRGAGLAREMKWLGSHRYATLNLGGESRHDLEQRYRAVCRQLSLEAH